MSGQQPTPAATASVATAASPDNTAGPSPATVWLAAVGCGVLVASIYYAQPLIDPISEAIGLSRHAAGLIVTVMQLGYGFGLALIVPLADRYENRRLLSISLLVTTLALFAIAFAHSPAGFLIPAAIVGFAAVGAQILLPMVAGWTPPADRGRVIGTIMSGLLGGIMLARPAASFLTSLVGWRGAFMLAAAATLAIGILLRLRLPVHHPHARIGYLATLRSTIGVIGRYSALRRRMLYQMLLFAVFSAFWTTIPLLLADRFGYGQRQIALFALAGAGGAFVAPFAGRWADRGHTGIATMAAALGTSILLALTAPFAAMGTIVGLAGAAIFLDAFIQTNQIVSQRIILTLSETERARINAAYLTSMFLAGALASAAGPVLYAHDGWRAMAIAGATLALPILAIELSRRLRGLPSDGA